MDRWFKNNMLPFAGIKMKSIANTCGILVWFTECSCTRPTDLPKKLLPIFVCWSNCSIHYEYLCKMHQTELISSFRQRTCRLWRLTFNVTVVKVLHSTKVCFHYGSLKCPHRMQVQSSNPARNKMIYPGNINLVYQDRNILTFLMIFLPSYLSNQILPHQHKHLLHWLSDSHIMPHFTTK